MADVTRLGVVAQLTQPLPRRKTLDIGSDAEIASCVREEAEQEFSEIVFDEGSFYVWLGACWGVLDEDNLISRICAFDGATYPTAKGEGCIRISRTRVESVLFLLRSLTAGAGHFEKPATGINCANGFVAFGPDHQPALMPHHPDLRQRHVIAGSWTPGASGLPPEASMLSQLLCGCFRDEADAGDKADLLAEIAAAAALGIATAMRAPKAIILYGPSAENGKSQVMDLFRSLLPGSAVTIVPPHKMSDDRFVVRLAGKLLNASDELADSAIYGENFKAAVTGDRMTGRDVYKAAVDFKPRALHVLAGNCFPSFEGGMDAGVRRRLLVIPFNRKIPMTERINGIGRRIGLEEADLLLAWVVNGAARLLARGSYAILEASQTALNEWITLTDVVGGWLRDPEEVTITGSAADIAPTKVAYPRFTNWCRQEGIHLARVPSHGKFTMRVEASGLRGLEVARRSAGSAIKGLRLNK